MTQDPDQIRDGIEQTQRELSANVDALTAKLSPQRIMRDQVQRARTVLGSGKERASATPVAAGLIVLGVSWLLAWLIWPSRPGRARPGGRGR